jgi:hypothetical protein
MNYKGQLKGFPEHIVNMMLDNQEAQGNKRDVTVFERCKKANRSQDGFTWEESKEDEFYWVKVIEDSDYDTPIPIQSTQSLQELKIELLIKKQESKIARFNSDVIVVTLCEEFIKDLKELQK